MNVPPEYLGNTNFVGTPPEPSPTPQEGARAPSSDSAGAPSSDATVQHGTLGDIVSGIGSEVTSAITGALGNAGGGSSVPPGGFNITPPSPGTTGLVGGGKRTDPEQTAAEQAYFDIWGVEAPHGYIPELMRKGMNLFEIIDHELAKPAVRRTQYYVDRYSNYAQVIAQLFGTR